jgi:hypothetical protein
MRTIRRRALGLRALGGWLVCIAGIGGCNAEPGSQNQQGTSGTAGGSGDTANGSTGGIAGAGSSGPVAGASVGGAGSTGASGAEGTARGGRSGGGGSGGSNDAGRGGSFATAGDAGEGGVPATVGNPPSIQIEHPGDGDVREPCPNEFPFISAASDVEDGELSATIEWTSSLDGALGVGARFDACLTTGRHVVTARVEDSDGNSASASIELTITGSDGGAVRDPAADDFERNDLGPDWQIAYPSGGGQVQILGGSDLGMGSGDQGFFLVNWIGSTFTADQFCEATLPADVNPDWIHQVYVRWRASDGARYGFGYDGDPNQADYGSWYFKYDGVPSADTRMIATADAADIPGPSDVLRIEVEEFTLRGYFNGTLVLEATDVDDTRIADGVPGLAARWATGNGATATAAKVWESWSGGSL